MCGRDTRRAALLVVLALVAFVLPLVPSNARASCPAHSETLAAGPYIVQVNLSDYPPVTDQSDEVTVVPQDGSTQLSGTILMLPGLGTDAVTLRAPLAPVGQSTTLTGSIRMPVRGAWQIEVQLNGPQGAGEASFPIVVAAPGAIPIWLGWLIGATPLLGIAWIVYQQRRYRQKLLAQQRTATREA